MFSMERGECTGVIEAFVLLACNAAPIICVTAIENCIDEPDKDTSQSEAFVFYDLDKEKIHLRKRKYEVIIHLTSNI